MTMWPRRTLLVAMARADSCENDSSVISSVGLGHGGEVVEGPERLEAELLRLLGELDGVGPGLRRVPALVLAPSSPGA